MYLPLWPFLTTLLITSIMLWILRPVASRLQLIDIPKGRKQHQGKIPLIGGLALFTGLAAGLLSHDISSIAHWQFIGCAAVIVVLGAFDDALDLSVSIRLLVQSIVAIAMMLSLDLHLAHLGNLFGAGSIDLGWFGPPLTVIAVIAAINAFNMTDGIDGLAGTLSFICMAMLSFFMLMWGQQELAIIPLLMMMALIPYLAANLQWFGLRKVFLGDAGSMLIGLTVIWLLLQGSQSPASSFRPVTALWIIAIPLLDMAVIMIRRLRKGQSPFKADREHLHHISLRMGLNSRQALMLIAGLAGICASIGALAEYLLLPEGLVLLLFLALAAFYYYLIAHIWRLLSALRKRRRHDRSSS
ncbi:UDP-N-acetylglucosamine--undecaprenyl-phosphate N-acetylglucosaminephosphotransferase [Alkalimonas collagenimarina]|uniref:Undecaprenyl-phosphate alpha-N-acetylglucosaminyl 1-phosphate transferase n=1 Tax=Alkalimonas collagenimarina TaxID=400390 RepID=A0ABT9H0B6_9GAMM|nr:UDP-N-acetylglucosamine--undecaprenyl-phosphate N-acetylglucosaminephosphotransferase [Alkalimonas collagenimarina]MDP4536747.1 UDP-N-acetylglucosamine--undecaprenyl-phosphate N-acetylglucosaminephosphotransferase [Alkalimonas collagenimarina]